MKTTFIPNKHRPIQNGATLDLNHITSIPLNFDDSIYLEEKTSPVKTLCFGPKNDRVLQLIERHINPNSNIKILYLEDLFKSWSFICRNGDIHFIIVDKIHSNLRITPTMLYFRSALYDEAFPYWRELSAFTHLLNLWKGFILCRPMQHTRNCSKLLQLNTTIIPAIKKSKAAIKIPRSYVIKGKKNFKKIEGHHVIVKSLSNLKSDVIDEQEFKKWDKEPLNYLPVLFQEVITGADIRIHKIYDVFCAKKITKKPDINYRYDIKSDLIQEYTPHTSIKKFCSAVSEIENNPLLGIDFLEINEKEWVCLEANPGPGWSAYHWDDLNDGHSFLSAILKVLHNEQTI